MGYHPYDTQSGTLAKCIVSRRRAMGLTQKEFARRLGVDPGTLGRWETGRNLPSKRHCESLPTCLDSLASVR